MEPSKTEAVARQKVANLAATKRWVIEGVYGRLAEAGVPRATALIWLDIRARGLLAHHGTASAMLHKGERRDDRGQHVSTRAENGRKSLQRRT